MGATPFEREVWEACARCRLWEHGTPNFQDPERNQRYAARLEAVASRLDEIHNKHGLGKSEAGRHLAAAREHLSTWAQGLREYPMGSLSEQELKTGHIRIEGWISRAVDAHRGVKPVPPSIADRLDRLFDGVLEAGDQMKFGKVAEALKTVEQLLSTTKSLRTELTRQLDRGPER